MKLGTFRFGGDGGKDFDILLIPKLKYEGERVYGTCENPHRNVEPVIRVDAKLKGKKLLETLLHEAIHATSYHTLSEDYALHTGKELAEMLWALGYRLPQ